MSLSVPNGNGSPDFIIPLRATSSLDSLYPISYHVLLTQFPASDDQNLMTKTQFSPTNVVDEDDLKWVENLKPLGFPKLSQSSEMQNDALINSIKG